MNCAVLACNAEIKMDEAIYHNEAWFCVLCFHTIMWIQDNDYELGSL